MKNQERGNEPREAPLLGKEKEQGTNAADTKFAVGKRYEDQPRIGVGRKPALVARKFSTGHRAEDDVGERRMELELVGKQIGPPL